MKILVACEESQRVTQAFRDKGHEAYSCDLLPTSGLHPDWHIQGDVLLELQKGWDLVLAFPPCDHLASNGARWFEQKRKDGRQQQGINFFLEFTKLTCPWVIENPIGIMSTHYRKPDQIIQPYQFGHPERKSTCLWLNKVPKLVETQNVKLEMLNKPRRETDRIHYMSPSAERSKLRSKTYLGIAKAMAEQWSWND